MTIKSNNEESMMKLVAIVVLEITILRYWRFESCYFQMTTIFFKKLIRKDYKNRLKFLILEVEYKMLKSIACNKILPLNLRLKAFHNLYLLKYTSTKIRNLCIFTGRPRGVITKFAVSRFIFRLFADNGYITGLKRASW